LVNIKVGSFLITMGAEGTIVWFFEAKKPVNVLLISAAFIYG